MTDANPAAEARSAIDRKRGARSLYLPKRARTIPRPSINPAVALKPTKDYTAPPLSWEAVERTLPKAKVAASILGWGNSFAMNIVGCVTLERALWRAAHPLVTRVRFGPNPPAGWPFPPFPIVGILMGLMLFIVLTGGQILTINRSTWGYRAMLWPDVLLTAAPWMAYIWLPILRLLVTNRDILANRMYTGLSIYVPAFALSVLIGYASAKLPEYLLFGRHPRKARHE